MVDEAIASQWGDKQTMKIGILTVHDQINYGAILQAFALQSVLSDLGHEVLVFDRKMDPVHGSLLGPIENGNIECWVKLIARGFLGLGDFADMMRRIRTWRFIRQHLHLTKYRFLSWAEAPDNLGVDLIVIGSDQVWNTKHHDPHVFLLDSSHNVPAISYAASFGTDSIDEEWFSLFARQLPKLQKISVREKQARVILSKLSLSAQRVVDPTLLPEKTLWGQFVKRRATKRRLLVCYFATQPSLVVIRDLLSFSKRNDCNVEIFVGAIPIPLPDSTTAWRNHIIKLLLFLNPRIHFMFGALPNVFVNSVANADWIVTSAFHGLMFSCIFRKQIRLVRSFYKDNRPGFKRMEEFVSDYMSGNVIVNDVRDALRSLEKETVTYEDAKLDFDCRKSLQWLRSALSFS